MDTDIFEQFPDRETFDKYWNENYQPVTYEDVREAFTDFVKSADGHIYLSDHGKILRKISRRRHSLHLRTD